MSDRIHTGTGLIGQYSTVNLAGEKGCLFSSGSLPGTRAGISMDILPINGLSLGYDIPALAPKIQLNAQGVTLTAGPPGAGAVVQLGPTGITLQFGPPGVGSSIQIDASGITFKAGPTTSAQLTPAGITLKGLALNLAADAVYQLDAKMLTESVTGIANRTAAMQKIG